MRRKQNIELERLRQDALEKRAAINKLARELIGSQSGDRAFAGDDELVTVATTSDAQGSRAMASGPMVPRRRASRFSQTPRAQCGIFFAGLIRQYPLTALLAGIAMGAVLERVVGKSGPINFLQPSQSRRGLKARLSQSKSVRALGKRLTSIGKHLGIAPSPAAGWKAVFGERAQALAVPIILSLTQHVVEGWLNSPRRPSSNAPRT